MALCHLAVVLLGLVVADAAAVTLRTRASANPVRKEVTMMQMMQNKVTEEGKKAEDLFDKFMCYCETADGTLAKEISDMEAKVTQLTQALKEGTAMKAQLDSDLKGHKSDRAEAKTAMAEATALREKEAAAFAANKARLESYIAAIAKAVAALEKGVATGFLQTASASVLRQVVISADMSTVDRQMLASFLTNTAGEEYVPQSG